MQLNPFTLFIKMESLVVVGPPWQLAPPVPGTWCRGMNLKEFSVYARASRWCTLTRAQPWTGPGTSHPPGASGSVISTDPRRVGQSRQTTGHYYYAASSFPTYVTKGDLTFVPQGTRHSPPKGLEIYVLKTCFFFKATFL